LTGFEAEVDVSCFKSVSRDLHSSSLRFLTMYSYVVMLLRTVIICNNEVTLTQFKTEHYSHLKTATLQNYLTTALNIEHVFLNANIYIIK